MSKLTSKKKVAGDSTPKSKAKEAKEAVYMNPLTDFGFKKLFSDVEVLPPFLNATIWPDSPIVKVELRPTEQLGDWESERRAVVDLLCTNERGEFFLVEMQYAPQKHFAERLLFYSSFLVRNQAPKGKKWNYELKAVYVLSLLNFRLDIAGLDEQQVISRVCLMEERVHVKFSDKLRFITIELPKFQKKANELETNIDHWLYYLKNMNRLKEAPATAKESSVFQRLFDVAQINKLTPKEMEAYHKSVLEYDDIVEALDYERERYQAIGEKQGEKRGKKQGIAIGEKRGAKKVYTELVFSFSKTGFPPEEIARFTKLSVKRVQTILQSKK
ncbi:MAG: Rpn family recombination-promoting nuclease/putative transposase [Prevotellaceae bacterium]|jgi:predicted transposase/invertase (TIGR01784 family)|nr:Rpn family recombination-promoting nuclease/putative transposase [Prevotellaceae bacterium]